MLGKVVPTADCIPDEVPGARWVALAEGGRLPKGYWRIVYRVQDSKVGIYSESGGYRYLHVYTGFLNVPRGILLVVAPLPSQHWWERYRAWLQSEVPF